jgi:hypothetical protein
MPQILTAEDVVKSTELPLSVPLSTSAAPLEFG